MANFNLPYLYGTNIIDNYDGVQGMSLQFHITAECDQNCKHCYMHNSPHYKTQIQNTLSKNDMLCLIDDFFNFLGEYGCNTATIALTGGDPILSPYFWDILEYINTNYKHKTIVRILGNPYHITDESAEQMRKLGVHGYQISIDGLRETHDYFRKQGSFDISLKALKTLHNHGILTIVAFTLSKMNFKELIPLYNMLKKLPYIDSFGFDRMIPVGNGEKLKEELFDSKEFRNFLFEILKFEIFDSSELVIAKKERMWSLLLYELGLVDPMNTKQNEIICGCNAGTGTISVLADGSVMPCRKLDYIGGKYPERSLKDIIINNDITKLFRQYKQYKGCSNCDAFNICRGCPAMKYAVTGDFFGQEPYCWRNTKDEK